MPVSGVQRRMRGLWSIVLNRADGYARKLPPGGVSRGRFVADVLRDVDPRDCDEVVEILARRGVVWLSRYRGEVTVYGQRPEARPERALVGSRPLDALFVDLAPLLIDALDAVEALRPRGTPPEVEEAARVNVGRILTVCRRKAASGLPLADMRAAMWRLLPPRLMTEIAYHEPRLQRASQAEAFEVAPQRPKRLPRGLTTKAKALGLIERAGPNGITRTDLLRAIQPRMAAADLAGIVGELEDEGAIVWAEMRLHEATRPGVRLFAASHGLPTVRGDGTMIPRE